MLKLLLNLARLFFIGGRFVSHGLFFTALRLYYSRDDAKQKILLQKFGEQLCAFLAVMGPTFIKLGQFLSTRPDVMSHTVCDQLTTLQDNLPPFPFAQVEKICRHELGQEINAVFAEFNPQAVAAASIAQVHKAKLHDGTLVAVKILRPHIGRQVQRDINFFMFMARIISFVARRSSKRLRLKDIVRKLEQTLRTELDLRLEAAAADELRHNCHNDKNINIPLVFWPYTSAKILILQWVDGIAINQKTALQEASINKKSVAKKIAVSFFNQAFRDGFFHADMHPGNIFVDHKGDVFLVDFGIMGVLDTHSRIFIAEILYAFINRDYERVADIHFEVGLVPEHHSRHLFKLACRSIGEPIIGLPVQQISVAKLLKHLFDTSRKFDMEIRPELLLLQKTMVTIEGIGYMLYPQVNMWQLAEPWIKQWARKNLGIRAKLCKAKDDLSMVLNTLPETLVHAGRLLAKYDEKTNKRRRK